MQIREFRDKGIGWKEINQENRAIFGIQESYFKNERKVQLNEHLEHEATPEKIEAVKEMWESGISLIDMGAYYKENPDNMFLILLHLAQKGRLKRRVYGLFT